MTHHPDHEAAVLAAMAKLDAMTHRPPGTVPLERGWILKRAPLNMPRSTPQLRAPTYAVLSALTALADDPASAVVPLPKRNPDDFYIRGYYYRPAGWAPPPPEQEPPALQPTASPA